MNFKMKTLLVLLICITLTSVVCAAEGHVDLTGSAEVTFYSSDSTVSQSGYRLSINYEDNTYYLDNAGFEALMSQYGGGMSGSLDEYDNELIQEGLDSYTTQMDGSNFSFDYESGQTVGDDSNANVITHIYSEDGSDVLTA